MFDLFRNREKTKRLGMGALLLLVSASMLLYLVPSTGTQSAAGDTVVAEVGKDVLTEPEVRRLIQNQVKGNRLPPEILGNYVPQMVDQMITERALAYEAQRQGFQISDAELASAIRQNYPSFFPDGKFIGRDMYAAFLAQQGLSIDEFENDLKRQMLITRMRDVAVEGVIVTPAEIEQEYRSKNEKIKVQWVTLTGDKYKQEVQPTMAEMQDFYRINAARYQVPESRNLVVLVADQTKLEAGLMLSDLEIQRAYNQNLNSFRLPERVHVRGILLKTEGKPASEAANIQTKAAELVKQLRGGADFAELAKKNSEDPASATKGGDLDWLARGQLLPDAEKVVFSLKPGQVSDPVKTSIGYQIFQVLQHDDARVRPLSEVKDELTAQFKKQRVNELMQTISDRAQAELQKDPAHPEKVAAELHMELVRADGWRPGQAVPGMGTSADFDQAVGTLKKGDVSQVVAPTPTTYAVAVVTDVIPPKPLKFEEVEAQVRDAMVANRLSNAVMKHAQDLVASAKANGGDLAKLAKAAGLEVHTSDEIPHQGSVPGLGSAAYVRAGFSSPDGTVFGPVATPEGQMVAKVIAHIPADMSKLAEQRNSVRDELKQTKARDRDALFEAGLVQQLTRKGVIKEHKQVVERLLASFRG